MGHNLAFLIWPSPERPARTSSHGRPQTTRPNEFTRAPSNDPPERFCVGARTTETIRQGRPGQTSCMNVHKGNLVSQLSIFDTALARTTRPNEFTRAPSNDPPERFCMGPRTTETNRQGRAGQTSCTNVHKSNLGSQLSIFYTALARTNMQKTHGRSRLSIFGTPTCARAPTHGTTRPDRPCASRPDPTRLARTRLHEHPHTTRHDTTRTKFGVSLYAQPERNLGFPWVRDPNEGTRQRRENGPHERVEGTRGVMT